jgi:hypothetical protein
MSRLPALLLLLCAAPALADVTLAGAQHLGDDEDPGLDPRDPVTRLQMQANPTHFHLSQATLITAVRLNGPDDLDDQLQVFIDDMSTPLAGTLSGSCDTAATGACTYTLTAPLPLAPGVHTIWPDGGCSLGDFPIPCAVDENDFSFASLTLVAAQTTASRNFNRRQHLGDNNEADNNYDGLYPDRRDGSSLTLTFTLEISRVLSELRFYQLRDVAAAPLAFASVLVDGVPVGNLTANGNPFLMSASQLLAAGAHTLTVTAGAESGVDLDEVSWDDLLMLLGNNPAITPGLFNAVDTNGDAATGAIMTKQAGVAFNLDLVAVTAGVPFIGYAGDVTVELLDASNAAAACATWPAVRNLGTVTFAAADNGRKPIVVSYDGALPDARIRIYEPVLGITSCSFDNFAIRPATFGNLQASHGDSRTAGTAELLASGGITAGTTPVHRAGRPFTLQATALNGAGVAATGYAGSPTVAAVASVLGTQTGSATASGWTASAGTVRSDSASYDEAGAARLQIVDTDFAAVDADDTPDLDRFIGPAAFEVGRFIPDRFTFAQTTPALFVAGCGSFTYVGQPFAFFAVPEARITAVAMDGSPTRNYSDAALNKIPLHAAGNALPVSTYAAVAGTFDTSGIPDPDNTFVSEGNGRFRFTLIPRPGGYQFTRGAPSAPFDADVTITLAIAEPDGVTFDAANAGRFGTPAPDAGIPFQNGATFNQLRFGRLVVDNAHGSERLPLSVPLRAEYWETVAGTAGFVRNLADNCTSLLAGQVTLAGAMAGPPDPPADTSVTAVSAPLVNGLGSLTLAAPNDSGQATVTAVIAAALPWLQTDDNDADTTYDDNPSGLAAFGVFRNDDRRIYLREVVGP